ncbi:MAG: hypothetical protein WCV50_01475 [Patescibacteria group bacterium]|jgi:succinate dehydrogenase hydrophobic anchor subunit
MFETSKDILFIGLATCAVVLTFFLCWGLYYLIMILKKGHDAVMGISEIIVSVKEKINRLEQLFNTIEEKLTHTASYLPLVLKGVTELLDYLKKKKEKRQEKKEKNK